MSLFTTCSRLMLICKFIKEYAGKINVLWPYSKHVLSGHQTTQTATYLCKVWRDGSFLQNTSLEPYLHYPAYENLRDESYCNKARVQNGVVVWDKETDMDPDRLYLESKLIEGISL